MIDSRHQHFLEKTAFNHLKKVIDKYDILKKGSSVLVGLSGGIDSFALVELLHRYNLNFSRDWEINVAHVNPGFDGWRIRRIEQYLTKRGLEYEIITTPIAERLVSINKNRCFFCSRMRRRYLVEHADRLSINTVALAHHKEDVAETLLLNLLYARSFGTMVARQSILQGRFFFIRPLYYFEKGLVREFARACRLPHVNNRCPYAARSAREEVRRFLNRLKKKNKTVIDNIFYGITNIKSQYLP